MSLKNRIKALEARRKALAAIQPKRPRAATVDEMNAELDAVCAKLDLAIAEDAERRALIGETAWAAVLVERERAADVFEWNILQGRFPKRDDLEPANERRVNEMLTDLAKAWQVEHEIAGTWQAVVERMTRLDAERDQSKDE